MFCRVLANNYLCNVLCKFLIKIEAHGGAKSKNRHPSWLYCTAVGLSEAIIGATTIKKAVLKKFPIFTGKNLCCVAFRPATFLKRDSNTGVSCEYCEIFKSTYLEKYLQERLLLDCFDGSLLHRYKASRSILYDRVRLKGPSYRSSFLFLSRHLWSCTESRPVFENLRGILWWVN